MKLNVNFTFVTIISKKNCLEIKQIEVPWQWHDRHFKYIRTENAPLNPCIFCLFCFICTHSNKLFSPFVAQMLDKLFIKLVGMFKQAIQIWWRKTSQSYNWPPLPLCLKHEILVNTNISFMNCLLYKCLHPYVKNQWMKFKKGFKDTTTINIFIKDKIIDKNDFNKNFKRPLLSLQQDPYLKKHGAYSSF